MLCEFVWVLRRVYAFSNQDCITAALGCWGDPGHSYDFAIATSLCPWHQPHPFALPPLGAGVDGEQQTATTAIQNRLAAMAR